MTGSLVLPSARTRAGVQGWLAVVALSGLVGCNSTTKERPPYGGGCSGAACGSDGVDHIPGSSGDGGAGGASAAPTVDLTGDLLAYVDDTFGATSVETGTGTVYGEPVDGIGWKSATFDGTSYTLEDVKKGRAVWMGAKSNDTAKFMLTFGLQNTTEGTAKIPLAKTVVLDDIFTVAGVSETPLTTAAQVLVHIVDSAGLGVSGVSVISGAQGFVAYSEGNQATWSTAIAQTTADGVALLGNVATSVFPGKDVTLTFTGAVNGEIDVPTAAGAVTVLRTSP